MQQRQLEYATSSRCLQRSWWATFWWTLCAVVVWWSTTTGAIVLYADLHIRHGWPALPEWFDYGRVVGDGGAIAVAAIVIVLGIRGKLPIAGLRRR